MSEKMLSVMRSLLEEQGLAMEIFDKPFTEETKLKEDLFLNESGMIDLVMELESKYDTSFSDEEVESAKTVGDLIALVEKRFK